MTILRKSLYALILVSLLLTACGAAPETDSSSPSAGSPSTLTAIPPTPTMLPIVLSERLDGSQQPVISISAPAPSAFETDRPGLSDSPLSIDTQNFRIHYTLSGDDATIPDDTNANGIPDFVEEVAQAMEYAWWAEITHFGWPQPPSDISLGGSHHYDVYLVDVESQEAAGFTTGDYEAGSFGDNSHTGAIESRASSSYIELDRDYADYSANPIEGLSLLDYMRSTAAHEFLHAIQFGIDADEPHSWLWEAAATWIQDETWDTLNDANEYLSAVFKSPDSCLLEEGGSPRLDDDSHWYGSWILIRYFSEHYGHEFVRQVWEQAGALDSYAAWDAALAPRGLSLEDVFRDYSLALLTRDFSEGRDYPLLRLEGRLNSGGSFSPPDGVAAFGADYVEILAPGPVTVSLSGSGLQGYLAGIRAGQADLIPFTNGGASADAAHYDNLYAVVLNLSRAENRADCSFADYTLSAADGGAPAAPAAQASAANFEAPRVEIRLTDLALGYLPAGFSYESAYQMERSDYLYPDFVDVVIPGPGPAYVLDYYNPDTDYLTVYASDSPYPDLPTFLAAQSLLGDEVEQRTVAGQPVLFVDYSDENGFFSTATLIDRDRFIVIEGATTPAELELVLTSYLAGEGAQLAAVSEPQDLALNYVPDGFEFFDAYDVEKVDFYNQEDLEWFIPGPGPATLLDYFNETEDYVSLVASLSPYQTLNELFAARDYDPAPGELINLAGYDVFLEDYTDADGPYSYATFIYGDLFIVIEGFITVGEMRQVAQSWLSD